MDATDLRYQSYGARLDKPIGVFEESEPGRHRFMDAVHRVSRALLHPRSRLEAVAFERGDAVLYALAVLLEQTRRKHGFSTRSVDELLARLRKRPKRQK
jgi:hypothetical protein